MDGGISEISGQSLSIADGGNPVLSQFPSDRLFPRARGQGQGVEVPLETCRATRLLRVLVQVFQVAEDHIVDFLGYPSLNGLDNLGGGSDRIALAT